MPAVCPFCQGPVGRRTVQSGAEGALLICQSAECPENTIGKIKRWTKSLKIDGIGESATLYVRFALHQRFPFQNDRTELLFQVRSQDRRLRHDIRRLDAPHVDLHLEGE